VDVAVKWQISDPFKYLFFVNDPMDTVRSATESAVREVIGKNKLDYILTEGRGDIADRQQVLLQSVLEEYGTGILVVGVEMQSAKPPDQVKEAFDDAIKAREDEQRTVNEAEAYSNDILPKARGQAARIREEANAYKARVIARAEGQASRFDQQLAEYRRAPEITRQRLYLDAMEGVLSNTSKVLIDSESNNSLIYLPIEQLMKRQKSAADSSQSSYNTGFMNNPSAGSGRSTSGSADERLRGVR